jgi:two-component sensor histidine kinase
VVHYASGTIVLLSVLVLLLMWTRRMSVLDLWVMVAICMLISEMALVTFGMTARFSLAWYVSRALAVAVSTVVLVALLSEAMRFHARQALLVAELDHRVKNILAQVAVVASFTRLGSRSVDEFLKSLEGRIQSMAAAHNLLSKAGWQSVRIDALVRNELAPYTMGANVTISGTDITLRSVEIQALARVLHELATNAVKHGALSIPDGQVSVSWGCKTHGDVTHLILVWRELGGPQVASDAQSSYGISLIRNLIPHELGGTVDLVLGPEGVSCKIEFPLGQV